MNVIQTVRSVILFFVSISSHVYAAWDISLKITQQASNGIGSEVFAIQPIIEIFDKAGINKHVNIEGRVVASLSHADYKDEKLGIAGLDECDVETYRQEISVDVVEGDVNFSGLCINRSGDDYKITYTLFDEFDIILGDVIQSNLSVEVGEPFAMGIVQHPIDCQGGVMWSVNPIVAIQDRGRNTVKNVNDGNVTVALASNEKSEELVFEVLHEVRFDEVYQVTVYQVISPHELNWTNGTAEFHGLSIKTVGNAHRLNFTTDVELPGGSNCVSSDITVNTGPPHALLVSEEQSSSDVYGGKAFINQPLLHIVDAGDNLVEADSSSRVFASLYNNPGKGGTLKPFGFTFATAEKGVVRFNNLYIAEAAKSYRLQYTLEQTNITAIGNFFDVKVGSPQGLKILQQPRHTLAGNQPFKVQPKVALVDAGGNTLSDLSDLGIDVAVVQSLSQTSDIIVDTCLDSVPSVTSIHLHPSMLNDNRISYSNGHNISIVVNFNQEVAVSKPPGSDESELNVPTLTLKIIDAVGSQAKAYLSEPISIDSKASRLTFIYTVAVNYLQSLVDIFDGVTLVSNDYFIRDAWYRNVSLSIPTSSVSNTPVVVHNQPAHISQITSSVPDGEYGAGHDIDFTVEFSDKVIVKGNPFIPLRVKSTIAIIDTISLGTSLSTSYFYILYRGEISESIPWDASSTLIKAKIEKMENVFGSVCVSRAKSVQSDETGGFRWAIRFDSIWDDLQLDFSTKHATVFRSHKAINLNVTILAQENVLNDWIRVDGDEAMCTFRYAKYLGGSGTNLLSYRYVPLPGDTSSGLSLSAPPSVGVQAEVDFISTALNEGRESGIDADLIWGGHFGRNIVIDTSSPQIMDVIISGSTSLHQPFHAGDVLFFQVIFDMAIIASESIRLRLYSVRYEGAFATFHTKSTPNSITFKYIVLEGHWSFDLKLQGPESVIIVDELGEFIRRDSTFPLTDVNRTIPWSDISDLPKIEIEGKTPKIKKINYSAGQDGQNFVKGDEIFIEAQFSTPVVLYSGPPVLIINAGSEDYNEAVYSGGNQTATLTFKYIVVPGDGTSPLSCNLLCVASGCLEGASNEGYILQMSAYPTSNAGLTFPRINYAKLEGMPFYTLDSPLSVDTTITQTIVESVLLWHEGGVVGVGEVIRLRVIFSDKVFCKGRKPELSLNTYSNALYESGTGTKALIFVLQSKSLDVIQKLSWELVDGTDSPIICDHGSVQPCTVLNGNNDPVNLSFIDHGGNQIVPELSTVMEISSVNPTIVSVYSDVYELDYCENVGCTYTAGDWIAIYLQFDIPVFVSGSPTVKLEAWDAKGDNIYAVYDETLSNDTDIVFRYEVILPGHTSRGLPLTYSQESVHCDSAASIRRKSTFPTIEASLVLPILNDYPLRNKGNAFIVIEAISVPSVRRVSFGNETGAYTPGDRLLLTVEFDNAVSITGDPVLLLDVGRTVTGCAHYLSGTNTKSIIFEYDVQLPHCTTSVDYINRHSLAKSTTHHCNNNPGAIKRASATPTIDANLTLPDPGMEGSLSSNASILLDCKTPFISKLWSPQSPGRYSTDDVISVMVEFSRAVIVQGNPTLLLETGDSDRKALFKSQLNSTTLEFQYLVKLGDISNDLDYWANEGIDRTSFPSLNLQGGSIMVPASNPILNADTHVNPAFGHLDGLNTNILISEGEAEYFGLKIGKRGDDYKIRFRASSGSETYDAEMTVLVSESCEFELNGNEHNRDFQDKFGSAVALSNDLLAVGAPKKKVSTAEVQVLRVQSEATTIQREVQLVTTQVDIEKAITAIQTFSTFGAENSTIDGYFFLEYTDPNDDYLYSSPLRLPADVDAIYMQTRLRERLPVLGDIEVVRETNVDCKCTNGWTWIVTFLDASKGIGLLSTDGSDLEGNGSYVTDSKYILQTNMLGGFFILENHLTSLTSRDISTNASAIEMKEIIESDLGIDVFSIQVSNLDRRDIAGLGRRWTITFASHIGTFGEEINVPNLEANSTFLTGANATAWTHVGSEGKSPLSGSFALSLRGSNFSNFIPHDASEDDVKEALESLESVNEVAVTGKRSLSLLSGHEWTITFKSVNVLTAYGWILDPGTTSSYGNLPTLEVKSHLIGWKVKTIVDYESGSGSMDTQAQWMAKEMGDDGTNSGEVAIYREASNGWNVEAYVSASDRTANDNFGSSISLKDNLIAIGAPNKEVTGQPEKQTIGCFDNPTGGTFTISLRGHQSDNISYDSSINDIRSAIQGIYGSTQKVHSIPALVIESDGEWANINAGFCSDSGNNVTITLLTPDGGGTNTDATSASGDIELLKINQEHLVGGSVEVVESRKGTRTLSGPPEGFPLGRQSGAVYLFERGKACEFCEHRWKQIKKFTALDCLEIPVGSELFGFSVAFQGNILFVGSPGFGNNTGKVYTFKEDSQHNWQCGEYLTSEVWKEETPGDQFGYSIAANMDDTLLVGSPGQNENQGSAYVFRQNPTKTQILSSQEIKAPLNLLRSSFGHAISIHDNQAILCAPYQNEVGSCYIYLRESVQHHFVMSQELIPSNIQKYDRFGWSASIAKDKILVGQLQNHDGNLSPSCSVQTITTRCGLASCEEKLGSSFQLSWRDGLFTTRPLSHSISSKKMKCAIEEDLHSGKVRVERTESSDENGGFIWSISFLSHGHYASNINEVPKLHCDSRLLSGSMPLCDVSIKNDRPVKVRGKAHLFTDDGNTWTEQAYLFPAEPQPQDFFGTSVVLNDDTALVGAPNRNLLNMNSGAAIAFDLSFTNFFFESNSYAIREGESLMLPVKKRDKSKRPILGIKSLDINADDDSQNYFQALWGLPQTKQSTAIQTVSDDSALANNQYYGGVENRSEWINGMFDYRGMHDYQSINSQEMAGSDTTYVSVKTTDDMIFEAPDETLTVQITLPGMFASPLGHLGTRVTIEDNGDGFVGNETHYTKILGAGSSSNDKSGRVVDVLQDESYLVVGGKNEDAKSTGFAHLYTKDEGQWKHVVELLPTNPLVEGSNFGQSVSISKSSGGGITILIGEPGQVSAHLFVYNQTSGELAHESELRPFNETFVTEEHKFASRNSVAVNGAVAFVGASKLEAVFVYRRTFDTATDQHIWNQWSKLRSSDYDFDRYDKGHSVEHIHKQRFGMNTVAKNRYLLVSAPHADYGNRGDISTREEFDTNGLYNVGLGKGKVYIFHSKPFIFKISFLTQQKVSQGSFKVSLNEFNTSSAEIAFDATAINTSEIIEDFAMIGKVEILQNHQFDENLGTFHYSWTFAFLSIFDTNTPSIEPIWHGYRCNECVPIKDNSDATINPNISIEQISTFSPFAQEDVLQGEDVTSGDCFGCSIDFDDDLVIVGAPFSSAKTRTTWDFETGDLTGWFATGNAFDHQPTYGDNSRRRMIYKGIGRIASFTSGEPQSSLNQGRYYIGTYEKRPGNKTDYLLPDSEYHEGDIQGDEPIGTLLSDPFVIEGEHISFLIGGGCNHNTEYIELLVDGFATMRATGQCSESMDVVDWNVAAHKGRAAQIKIVDASSTHWGHINVDRIQFSWTPHGTKGGCSNTGGAIPVGESDSTSNKQHYTGREESPRSGSAYIFKRQCKYSLNTVCVWMQEQRLVPSDKRSKNLFGASVSIHSANGIAVVGSPNSPIYGFYKETPSIHPFTDMLVDFPVEPNKEPLMKSANILSETPSNLRLMDHIAQNATKMLQTILPEKYSQNAGAFYSFFNLNMNTAFENPKQTRTSWPVAEDARIAPPDIQGNTMFGSSISLAKTMVVTGAKSGGAFFLFGLQWQRVRFASIEYVGLEGTDNEVTINVIRDVSDTHISIGYSSSDLSATGVDKEKASKCEGLNINDRSGCGDYEQSSGVLEFAAGQSTASFPVRVIDDLCWERHMEYVQLNLHIPGGAAIQGEQFRAQLRIDDDDWDGDICSPGIS